MMSSKISIIAIVVLVLTLPHTIANNVNYNDINISETPDNYLIEGIPYVPQTEGYFCYYADITMILKFYGFDLSLEDILFYDGLGYIHSYHTNERLPFNGRYCNFSFVLDLFGSEFNRWYPEEGSSNDESWKEFYIRLQENISNDIPVITRVDPFSLSSLRNQFIIPDLLWKKMFPTGHHLILIVGYNDSNQSICYNDPNAGFYGDNSYGNYSWMNLDDFRAAIENNIWKGYMINIIKQENQAYTKKERFEKTLELNIKKLEGNYKDYWIFHGINATKRMKVDFTLGENNRSETINEYKKYGDTGFNLTFREIMYKLFSKLAPNRPNIFKIYMVGIEDPFYGIAREKYHVAYYLENSIFYPDLCKNQSILLKQESNLWNNLSNYFKVFLRRGIHLWNLRANILMNKMEKIIDEIILIEQQILDDLHENWPI